jgi:hypothetical protein
LSKLSCARAWKIFLYARSPVAAKKTSASEMGDVHGEPDRSCRHALVRVAALLVPEGAKVVAKEGAAHSVRANVVCPGCVPTPLVDKQIPEQAKERGITAEQVIMNVMLTETVDREFTTVEDVAEATLLCAAFPTNAMTGRSVSARCASSSVQTRRARGIRGCCPDRGIPCICVPPR